MSSRPLIYLLSAVALLVSVALVLRACSHRHAADVQAGQAECRAATATTAASAIAATAASQASQAQADIQRGVTTGAAHERARVRIDTTFRQLEDEARHAPPDSVDSCVLPADRLRIWTDANRGRRSDGAASDQGAAAGQPDGAASAAAGSGLGPDAGPGGEPPGDGAPVPPAGQPLLQPAGVPAGASG